MKIYAQIKYFFSRSDIKEEDADEYEDEDEDDVSRTPASSPNLSKTGCDSPGTDLHCDNFNSRNTQHQSMNQLDSKPPQAEQRTSLYDFIKGEILLRIFSYFHINTSNIQRQNQWKREWNLFYIKGFECLVYNSNLYQLQNLQ